MMTITKVKASSLTLTNLFRVQLSSAKEITKVQSKFKITCLKDKIRQILFLSMIKKRTISSQLMKLIIKHLTIAKMNMT